MKNKKRNLGKIALLTAALAVTVPTAVMLSACGSEEAKHEAGGAWQSNEAMHWHNCDADANDQHSFDLANHTWTTADGKYKCSVCDYVQGTVDDVRIRKLKAAWENLANYQGGITVTSLSSAEDGGSMKLGYNPTTGEGYSVNQQNEVDEDGKIVSGRENVMYVYKNAKGEYILCESNPNYQPAYKNEDGTEIPAVGEKYLFTKVNEAYFREVNSYMFGGGYIDLDDSSMKSFSNLFAQVTDKASFEANALPLAKNFIRGELDTTKTSITTTEANGVLTVKMSGAAKVVAGQPQEVVDMTITLKNGLLSYSMRQETITEDAETGKKTSQVQEMSQSMGYQDLTIDAQEPATVQEKPTISLSINATITDGENTMDSAYVNAELAVAYGTVIKELDYSDNKNPYKLKETIAAALNAYFADQDQDYALSASDVTITSVDGFTPDMKVDWKNHEQWQVSVTITVPAGE